MKEQLLKTKMPFSRLPLRFLPQIRGAGGLPWLDCCVALLVLADVHHASSRGMWRLGSTSNERYSCSVGTRDDIKEAD